MCLLLQLVLYFLLYIYIYICFLFLFFFFPASCWIISFYSYIIFRNFIQLNINLAFYVYKMHYILANSFKQFHELYATSMLILCVKENEP